MYTTITMLGFVKPYDLSWTQLNLLWQYMLKGRYQTLKPSPRDQNYDCWSGRLDDHSLSLGCVTWFLGQHLSAEPEDHKQEPPHRRSPNVSIDTRKFLRNKEHIKFGFWYGSKKKKKMKRSKYWALIFSGFCSYAQNNAPMKKEIRT